MFANGQGQLQRSNLDSLKNRDRALLSWASHFNRTTMNASTPLPSALPIVRHLIRAPGQRLASWTQGR